MHFWQLKTFWHESKLCEDDIECHSFEEISTEPAISVDQTDKTVMLAVAELIKFKSEFELIRDDPSIQTDLSSFWLRKTKKPVLAVLLTQKPGQKPKLHRGSNMEVSMPTGSLCAERNVIGSALADDMTLLRSDLKVLCVYSAGFPDHTNEKNNRSGKEESVLLNTSGGINSITSSAEKTVRSGSGRESPLSAIKTNVIPTNGGVDSSSSNITRRDCYNDPPVRSVDDAVNTVL